MSKNEVFDFSRHRRERMRIVGKQLQVTFNTALSQLLEESEWGGGTSKLRHMEGLIVGIIVTMTRDYESEDEPNALRRCDSFITGTNQKQRGSLH